MGMGVVELSGRDRLSYPREVFTDLITGLSSQRMLEDKLMLAIAQAKRSRELLAIALFDVENYEVLAKGRGQEAGEELLQELARRTMSCLRQSDTVARIGANTFALILPGVKSRTNAVLVANRVLEACRQPFPIREKIFIPSGSISLCFFPQDQQTFAEAVSKDEVGRYLSRERKLPQVWLTF
ncbi:MAG: diguanylate cyclase domain protein [Firmicutes bacterium]|nr:diguanylate cyclase domain protein [Bacillota bacterium]